MQSLSKKEVELINEALKNQSPEEDFTVKKSLGKKWSSVNNKQASGKKFKGAVNSGVFPEASHLETDFSKRRDIYTKSK